MTEAETEKAEFACLGYMWPACAWNKSGTTKAAVYVNFLNIVIWSYSKNLHM